MHLAPHRGLFLIQYQRNMRCVGLVWFGLEDEMDDDCLRFPTISLFNEIDKTYYFKNTSYMSSSRNKL